MFRTERRDASLRYDPLRARFKADRDAAYREFIDECGDFDATIAKKRAANHFT